MPEVLHIRRAAALVEATPDAAEARVETHRDTLPRAQGRRMNPLGLALDLTLEGDLPGAGESLVFITRHGTIRAVEDFLKSFPHPSPLSFQNAIHPAGIEQCLVPKHASMGELIPFADDQHSGMAAALRALFQVPGHVRRIAGGEERGTWLCEIDAAPEETFAFSMTLTDDAEESSIGTISRDASSEEEIPLTTRAFAAAIAERKPLRFGLPGFGLFVLTWR
jgi:hypothetical protein